MSRRTALTAAALAALVLPLAAGCVPNDTARPGPSGAAGVLTVTSTADACEVSADRGASGTVQFAVTNAGDDVTEFYLLGDDGLRVIAEVENVGPGLSRDLVAQVKPGTYYTACKPGMVGDGIRAEFTVNDWGAEVGPTGDTADQLAAAEASYVAYVKDQVGALIAGTQAFADAYTSGDDETARSRSTPTPARTGSASSRSPSRSATSTRCSTCARRTSRRARPGAAGTSSRRTSGSPRPTPTAGSPTCR